MNEKLLVFPSKPVVVKYYGFFYLNSFDAAFIEDERKVIFLIGILFLRSS